MKIAFDASQITIHERAGTGNYSYYLARALSTVDSKNKYIFFFRETPSIEIKREIFEGKPNLSFKILSWPFLWTHGALARETFSGEFDLLFMPYPVIPLVRNRSLKTVVTFHDLGFKYLPEYNKFPQRYLLKMIPRFAANRADRVVAVSRATKNSVVGKYGIDPHKVSVVYEGVDINKFQGLDNKIQEKKGKKVKNKYGIGGDYILFVGTIQPRKNLERLVAAFSKLKKTKNTKLSKLDLVIAGKRGWLADKIYSAPSRYGVGASVKFLGRVPDDDLVVLYQNAECFAFPSLLEGFGLPVLEAMAAGTPVVTSNVSSLPEVGGDAAFYVDPRDVEGISSGLREVLINTKLRKSLVRRGLSRVSEFSWENTARSLIEVFRGVNTKC